MAEDPQPPIPAPGTAQQSTDEVEHPQIQLPGEVPSEEISVRDLLTGVDIEDETPEEAHKLEHPTPNHPTGRVEP